MSAGPVIVLASPAGRRSPCRLQRPRRAPQETAEHLRPGVRPGGRRRGSRAAAEKELREREKRHAELELTPLSAESKAHYSAAWEEVQIQFVDAPGGPSPPPTSWSPA